VYTYWYKKRKAGSIIDLSTLTLDYLSLERDDVRDRDSKMEDVSIVFYLYQACAGKLNEIPAQ
jgi:hypothetical protein